MIRPIGPPPPIPNDEELIAAAAQESGKASAFTHPTKSASLPASLPS